MNIHSVSLKGKRDYNEDKHCIITNSNKKDKTLLPINLFCVFDGHGIRGNGKQISSYLENTLPQRIMKQKTFPFQKKDIINTFDSVQKDLKTNHRNVAMDAGSTCLIMAHYTIQDQTYINIFNVGDCRAILCRNDLAIPLTRDHKPDWPQERARIEALGGNIYFDGYVHRIKDLSVSRAFGDLTAEPYVVPVPDIFR